MYLSYQGNKHRLQLVDESTFEFRNSTLASQFVGTNISDPIINLASSLFAITDSNIYPENPKKSNRNLVYFTVNSDESYLKMLRICLSSLISHASTLHNVDFVVIMDSFWEYIALRDEFPEISLYLRQVKRPSDGIEASMNKLRIFELYPFATEYQKILFLDCDIVFNQDIQKIFALNIEDSKIYSVIHSNCHETAINTKHHNLTKFNSEMVNGLKCNGVSAFNTGQFLMLASDKMKRHFQNVNIIRDIWQGEFFFEQSFINTYFNCSFASDTQLLSEFFTIYYIGDNHMPALELDKTKNVHYAGSPCDGSTKIEWVRKEFCDIFVH
jgi:lipopolysaccharide biosynthesis glycosyltransferase